MKHTSLTPVFGLLPLLGLSGCGMFSNDRPPEVTNAARLNVAMAAEASGDSQMALQIYATALAKDPTDTKAAVQYARALVNNRQIGLAREFLSRQMAIRPGQPDLSREFGTIEVLQGQAASAVPRFDIALNANPNDVRALVNKGIALDMLGRHAEAQQLYHRADAISPDDPAVRNNLAMSLMLSGRAQEAGEVIQATSAGGGNTPRIRNNMAVVAAANGDMARARQLTAGEISDAELQSLATQLRSRPQPMASEATSSEPVAAVVPPVAPMSAPITAAAASPVRSPAIETRAGGALPLSVPAAASEATEPTAQPAPRVTPVRVQDKRSPGRLNMTQAEPETGVTPAMVTRVIEQAMEKEAAYIGEAPSVRPGPALAEAMRVLPAIAASPLRVRAAIAPEQSPVSAAPRRGPAVRGGYSVQLATLVSESGAQFEWRRLNERLPQQLSGREATVDNVTRADGRTFWLLRTPGFTNYSTARQFCDDLKLAGRDCFVAGGQPTTSVASPAAPSDASVPGVTLGAQSPEG